MEQKYITDLQGNKVIPITHVDAVRDDEGNSLPSIMGAFEDEVRGLVDTPHQEYVTVAATSQTTAAEDVLPASGQSADTIYRVSNWDGSSNSGAGAFDVTVYSEYAWDDVSNPAKYVFLCVKSSIGEVFDITAYNNNTKYADLTAALGTGGANIPEDLRKGGMSVKFVHSSDNKYVQYRLMAQNFTTDVTQWQGIDDEPTAGSENLVKSGGVADIIGISLQPFEYIQHDTGGTTQSTNGNRYSLLFNVVPGYNLTVQSSWGGGIFAAIWDDRYNSLRGVSSNILQGDTNYTKNRILFTTNVSGVLRIGTKKTDDSVFTQEDIDAFLASLNFTLIKQDSIQVRIDKLPVSVSFASIYTDGYFNANNTTKKIEIPIFKCFVENQVIEFSSHQIAYNWGTNNRRWFALVLSDDYSSIQMIDWVELSLSDKQNIIAFISRENIGDSNASAVMFYGCNSDSQKKSIWRIDGNVYIDSVVSPIKTQLDSISNLSWLTVFSAGYINANNILKRLEISDELRIFDKAGYHVIPAQNVSYNWGTNYRILFALVVSDDYSTINMVEWTQVSYNSKIIAFLMRNNYHYKDISRFYGGAGDLLFKIDGVNSSAYFDDVDKLKSAVFGISGYNNKVDYPALRHAVSDATYSDYGNRVTFGINVSVGDNIEVQSDEAAGIIIQVWNSFENGCVAPSDRVGLLQEITPGYTHSLVISTIEASGVLCIKWKKPDESAITNEEMASMLNNIVLKVYYAGTINRQVFTNTNDIAILSAEVDALSDTNTSSEKQLYLGPLVQNALDANGKIVISSSNTAVSQVSAIAVPYYGCRVNVKLPDGYCVKFKDGRSTTGYSIQLSNDSGWLHNGDSYTFTDSNHQIFRVCFGKNNGADTLTVEEVNNLMAKREIDLTYNDYSTDVVLQNAANEGYIKRMMRKFTGTLLDDEGLTRMPTFTHTSDVHGDAIRVDNFLRYSDSLEVDAAIISGDFIPMDGSDDRIPYLNDLIDRHNSKTLLCMGNHDARGGYTKQAQSIILAHTIDKYSLSTPTGEDYPTYYYHDIAAKRIRIISFNQWMPGQRDTNTWHYTQDQIDWLIATLASTPAGYGVIIVMHAPEGNITKDTNHAKFFQMLNSGDGQTYISWYPITKIVDAFISKTTLSGTFEDPLPNDETDTVTVEADFTNVASGVEFICYMNGHHHRDRIGYCTNAANMQLVCNVTLGFAHYGNSTYPYYAEMSDLPRGGIGMTQDSFNVYVVDRASGTLRIARVGSNQNADGDMRDWMIIPYKAS